MRYTPHTYIHTYVYTQICISHIDISHTHTHAHMSHIQGHRDTNTSQGLAFISSIIIDIKKCITIKIGESNILI